MIEIFDTGSPGQLELRMSGAVTADDYQNVLIPAVEEALSEADNLRLLVIFEQGVSFDMGAAWSDMKLGLSYWSGFDRLAVCAGDSWIATSVRAFAPIMPCPVQVFEPTDTDSARRWLRESLGAIHLLDLGGPALQVQLIGKVGPEDYARLRGDLDAKLREKGGFRLLVDLTEFDGWHGLSALGAHFSLARDHAKLLDRAAIVGDHAWQKVAQKVASRLLDAETRYYPSAEIDAAKEWLQSDAA